MINDMIHLSNKERGYLSMNTPTIVSFAMLISTLYCSLSEKKSKAVYLVPILCSTFLIVYNISRNPNSLTTTTIIAGIAGTLILSFLLCCILYFFRRVQKNSDNNTK